LVLSAGRRGTVGVEVAVGAHGRAQELGRASSLLLAGRGVGLRSSCRARTGSGLGRRRGRVLGSVARSDLGGRG
jgi:hypothetical protein